VITVRNDGHALFEERDLSSGHIARFSFELDPAPFL
jgi:hypothetical protein